MSRPVESKSQTCVIKNNDNNLPLGQKLLNYGFKRITDQEMYERFNCEEITNVENENRIKEVKKAVRKHNVKLSADKRSIVKIINIYPFTIPAIIVLCVTPILLTIFIHIGFIFLLCVSFVFTLILMAMSQSGIKGFHVKDAVKCTVKKDPLNDYVKDVISERCLEHITLAKRLGCVDKELFVAYPVLGKMEKGDSIVFYKLNDNMIEITQWE